MSQPPFILKIVAINGNPLLNTVLPVISGSNNVGDILTSDTGTWDGAPIVYTYQWRKNGINITRANSDTYEIKISDSGTDITCVITAYNCLNNTSATSNVITIN
jgi:hypothetical protein